jgi:hypothetical protein
VKIFLVHDTDNLEQFEVTRAFSHMEDAREFCKSKNRLEQEDEDEGPWQFHEVELEMSLLAHFEETKREFALLDDELEETIKQQNSESAV